MEAQLSRQTQLKYDNTVDNKDDLLIESAVLSKRIYKYRDNIREGSHKCLRQEISPDIIGESEARGLSWMQRAALLTQRMCEAEKVIIQKHENIVFTRTIPKVPQIYGSEKWVEMTSGRSLHELGPISNICADWQMVLSQGLLQRKQIALESRDKYSKDSDKVEFLNAAIQTIDAVLELTRRYAAHARDLGRIDLAEILERVPAEPPRSFHEALQFLRITHSVLWMSSHYHVGLGRFDQYMWPYLEADLQSGNINKEQAGELLAEFFISLNKDSDLYPGIQQGDNGQSLMLGGIKKDGTDGVNELTRMTLRVGCELSLIDPKINLRINKDTDLELLSLATKMTRKGLGFPQYSNDDVVIPALVKHGYSLEDARDYSVAACWEFLIPGKGMEIVNVGAVSMPKAVHESLLEGLPQNEAFDRILDRVETNIMSQVDDIIREKYDILLPPAPYYSVLMTDLLESGKDLSQGAKYNNYGIHGACVSSAADALAALKVHVFDKETFTPQQLLSALETDFAENDFIYDILKYKSPKVGNNDDRADQFMTLLFDYFASACESVTDNGRGGIVRPGSGSAMYYVWLADKEMQLGATADGRLAGEYFGANLAPSLNVQVNGPISVLKSFSKIDYNRISNGGPITIEFSDTVFNHTDSIQKVAMFIKTFAKLGCQQLQLNTLKPDVLIKAKSHPELYKNLIVRVWGWSGYFCELSPEYQDQIINRAKFGI